MSFKAAFSVIEVLLNRPLFQCFDYKLEGLHSDDIVGARVEVNIAGSREIGIVYKVKHDSILPFEKLKNALLLDEKDIFAPDLHKMLSFASNYYLYPLGQCYVSALPKMLRDGKEASYGEIPALAATKEGLEADCKNLKAKVQAQILSLLKEGPVKRKELRERGFSAQAENALIKKGFAVKVNLALSLKANKNIIAQNVLKEEPPVLNPEQSVAVETICAAKGYQAFLLNGVTGSGKTEVYLQVIASVLKKGQSALVLVPEIALTPQTFERFYNRFNVPVSSMHSALSDRERLDAFLDMQRGEPSILIGTRSALFTPIPNLGLIVIDEEHDGSFKQTDGFRYHARSLALVRAKAADCKIILGSATPSLESVENALCGKFTKLDLTIRAGGASLPQFKLIDLKNEPLTPGIRTGIGLELENRIGEETAKGNQVLLFLNRRGYSHHLFCPHCGKIFTCPNCDNPLTVHKGEGRLKCHVCDNVFALPVVCPDCGSREFMENGYGTEQVEEFLKLRYPDVGIERIDRDSVNSKVELERRLERIKEGKSQIMLGTQMLAKGHDFPDVTLVGILDIDSGLFSDDFRALESTAQLLTQVSGRAGRAQKQGEVIIQSYHPENELLNRLITPNTAYFDIALDLLLIRKNLSLPPFSYQAFLLSNSEDRVKAFAYLQELNSCLIKKAESYEGLSLGPVISDKMEKRHNRYHFHILVTALRRDVLNAFLNETVKIEQDNPPKNDVRFAIEVDPLFLY